LPKLGIFLRTHLASSVKIADLYALRGMVAPCRVRLGQGSQTQIDLGAASDSKKGLAGRIEKNEKNYLRIFSFKLNIVEKSRQNILKFFPTPNFLTFPGRIGPSRGPRVLDRWVRGY